jgi:hypothetical protein
LRAKLMEHLEAAPALVTVPARMTLADTTSRSPERMIDNLGEPISPSRQAEAFHKEILSALIEADLPFHREAERKAVCADYSVIVVRVPSGVCLDCI